MHSAKLVLYCRVPGLLAHAARQGRPTSGARCPLAVTEGRFIRSVCALAAHAGIKPAMSVIQARRLCPLLLTVAAEAVSHQAETSAFLDLLADHSPEVEPDGPDAAYVVLQDHSEARRLTLQINKTLQITKTLPLSLIAGMGISRLAARACAECDLPPDQMAEAAADWLWPEDPKVVAALKRLGLDTFGQAAAVGEDALFHQFGRIGRLLHRRALGQDLTPVRPLYPLARADARQDCEEYPLEDRVRVTAALTRMSLDAAAQLRGFGRFGRRIVLRVTTERGELRREWSLPAPVQAQEDVLQAAQRLLGQMTVPVPITSLRLLVEELETPRARTADLFACGPGDDNVALEAVRRGLVARFGLRSVLMASKLPVSLRQERQLCLREKWQAYR